MKTLRAKSEVCKHCPNLWRRSITNDERNESVKLHYSYHCEIFDGDYIEDDIVAYSYPPQEELCDSYMEVPAACPFMIELEKIQEPEDL